VKRFTAESLRGKRSSNMNYPNRRHATMALIRKWKGYL
jgi:hypothetical protein